VEARPAAEVVVFDELTAIPTSAWLFAARPETRAHPRDFEQRNRLRLNEVLFGDLRHMAPAFPRLLFEPTFALSLLSMSHA
jgi:hypothetical protein